MAHTYKTNYIYQRWTYHSFHHCPLKWKSFFYLRMWGKHREAASVRGTWRWLDSSHSGTKWLQGNVLRGRMRCNSIRAINRWWRTWNKSLHWKYYCYRGSVCVLIRDFNITSWILKNCWYNFHCIIMRLWGITICPITATQRVEIPRQILTLKLSSKCQWVDNMSHVDNIRHPVDRMCWYVEISYRKNRCWSASCSRVENQQRNTYLVLCWCEKGFQNYILFLYSLLFWSGFLQIQHHAFPAHLEYPVQHLQYNTIIMQHSVRLNKCENPHNHMEDVAMLCWCWQEFFHLCFQDCQQTIQKPCYKILWKLPTNIISVDNKLGNQHAGWHEMHQLRHK